MEEGSKVAEAAFAPSLDLDINAMVNKASDRKAGNLLWVSRSVSESEMMPV